MAGGGEGSGSGSGGCEVPPGQPGLVWEGESEEGVELGLEGGGGAHQGGGQGPGADTAMVTTNSNMYTGACTQVHCTYVHRGLYSSTLYVCTQESVQQYTVHMYTVVCTAVHCTCVHRLMR